MGVVSVSSSASRVPPGSTPRFSRKSNCRQSRRPICLAFKSDKGRISSLITQQEPRAIAIDTVKEPKSAVVKRKHADSKTVKAVCTDETSTAELDYSEVAATLENLYKLSPAGIPDIKRSDRAVQTPRRKRKATKEGEKKNMETDDAIKSPKRRLKRLSLHDRIALRKKKAKSSASQSNMRETDNKTTEYLDKLLRDYSMSTDLVSWDWKKMKIPAVLSSSEHTSLFKLLQPMKAILAVKEDLHTDLGREPTDGELANAVNMTVAQMRRHLELGRAARNKLIKVTPHAAGPQTYLLLRSDNTNKNGGMDLPIKAGQLPKYRNEAQRDSLPFLRCLTLNSDILTHVTGDISGQITNMD